MHQSSLTTTGLLIPIHSQSTQTPDEDQQYSDRALLSYCGTIVRQTINSAVIKQPMSNTFDDILLIMSKIAKKVFQQPSRRPGRFVPCPSNLHSSRTWYDIYTKRDNICDWRPSSFICKLLTYCNIFQIIVNQWLKREKKGQATRLKIRNVLAKF